MKVEEPYFISCPLILDHEDVKVHINAEGLSEHSYLKVEVLDLQFRPLSGYSGDDCIPITDSGFHQPIAWHNKKILEKSGHPIRIHVNWGGIHPEDTCVYAVCIS